MRLVEHLRTTECDVFFDHGDKTKVKDNVAAIKAFCGDIVSNENRLADVDVAVVKDGEVFLLAEIEERGSSPKKVLGDVMAVMLSNQVAILINGEQTYFKLTDKTKMLVVGEVSTKGSLLKKVKIMQKRLHALPPAPGSIDPRNVSLLLSGDLDDAIGKFENLVKKTYQ